MLSLNGSSHNQQGTVLLNAMDLRFGCIRLNDSHSRCSEFECNFPGGRENNFLQFLHERHSVQKNPGDLELGRVPIPDWWCGSFGSRLKSPDSGEEDLPMQ